MADMIQDSYEIYWTRDESVYNNSGSEDVIHSFAPGVDQPGNKRPTQKMQPGRPKEMPAGRALRDGRMRENDGTHGRHSKGKKNVQGTNTSVMTEVLMLKDKPSLKDLCPEDKKRIANLIRELAKVGEEKEVIVQQLNVERRSYEDRVGKLKKQMTSIMQERELTQMQYLECQKLLAEYQSQLASEQEKLAASFHLPSSPDKCNTSPQSATKPKPDNVPAAKNKLITHPSQRTPITANHLPTYQNATPGYPNGYHSAPHQNGYQYPTTHRDDPSLKQVHHPPRSVQQPSIGVYQGQIHWKQPPGTQQHPPPSTQQPHPPNDLEFNPLLASTSRPAQANVGISNTNQTAQQLYGNTQYPEGYGLQPSLKREIRLPQAGANSRYRSDSQETLPSRTQSGDFQPLQPELETDYESQGSNSPEHMAGLQNQDYVQPTTESAGSRFHGSFQGDSSRRNVNPQGPWNQFQDAGAQQPSYRTSPEHRHAVLERQRRQLHEEQAWLQQKLMDQEELLLQKQNQLEQHKLHQMEREWPRDHSDNKLEQEWQRDHSMRIPQTPNPQMNGMDQEWEEPHIFNGAWYKVPSGSENDNDDVVSTNFPPEGLINQWQPARTVENSLRRLNLNRSGSKHKDLSRGMAHARGVAMVTGNGNLSQERRGGETFQGYASLYPHAQSRHKIQGSTSSCSTSTSSSVNSHPAVVDQSTSPLYRDPSTVTSHRVDMGTSRSPGRGPSRSPGRGRLSLSPGRVSVTPAPHRNRGRELGMLRQEQRHPERRAVSLPRSPRQHSDMTAATKSNITHLSDLIAEMESPPPPSTTHARPVSTTHNTSAVRRGYRTTPDLFQDDTVCTDTDTEIQESRILEDVFFL